MSLHVLIIGAGLGGLCLAQGLRKAGVSCAVHERDASADSPRQGYRIHMNSFGVGALERCLPGNLFELYMATSRRPPRVARAVFRDSQFNELFSQEHLGSAPMDPRQPYNAVHRHILRQILLGGLDGIVHFGRTLVEVEQDDKGVRAHFAGGHTASGDVLVAADGIDSVVRRQLLPHAQIIDTGMCGIYSKTPLTPRLRESLPDNVFDGFVAAGDLTGAFLCLGVYQTRRPHAEAVAEFAPGLRLEPTYDYVMCALCAKRDRFPVLEKELSSADPRALHRIMLDMTRGWHPAVRRLLEAADVPECFAHSMRASLPIPEWPVSRVTFLGDAIHAMSPAAGSGANTALRDAALLARHLVGVDRGERELRRAIAEYENEMRDYAFPLVEHSLCPPL
jgi:2-polyprenyl-6-methoxyphenol hydroxylase-like FAD-dependent oxidoreductase